MSTKAEQLWAVRRFLDWSGDEDAEVLVLAYAATIIECDTAIMHGPGHQSVTECGRTGVHSEHNSADGRFEWYDKDIGTQTRDIDRYGGPRDPETGRRTKVTRTYRLASTGLEW